MNGAKASIIIGVWCLCCSLLGIKESWCGSQALEDPRILQSEQGTLLCPNPLTTYYMRQPSMLWHVTVPLVICAACVAALIWWT